MPCKNDEIVCLNSLNADFHLLSIDVNQVLCIIMALLRRKTYMILYYSMFFEFYNGFQWGK